MKQNNRWAKTMILLRLSVVKFLSMSLMLCLTHFPGKSKISIKSNSVHQQSDWFWDFLITCSLAIHHSSRISISPTQWSWLRSTLPTFCSMWPASRAFQHTQRNLMSSFSLSSTKLLVLNNQIIKPSSDQTWQEEGSCSLENVWPPLILRRKPSKKLPQNWLKT